MNSTPLFALLCLLALSTPLRAQTAGAFGVGAVVGNPTGGTAKLWVNDTQAVDAGLGFSTRFSAYADYLWHGWNILPQPPQGKLGLYFGAGGQIRAFDDAEFGVRAVAGAAYWLPRDPVEIFVELVPIFRLTPGDSVGLDGGVGARWYFKS
jgi:hypothetical protein